MAPVLDELALETAGKLKICKLNTDENQATAARFKIKAIPSLIFFRGGILLDQIPGAVSREAIMSRIGRFLADDPD
jgi:thioredoxin 1